LIPPSIESSPFIELKVLPKHLKYVYLNEQETFSVIIASHLTAKHEESLILILRKYKKTISRTMIDIKGLSLVIIQHRIHLNEEVTPKKDLQRRLNL